MKKFLVYLLAVVLVAAMGFSVFYLVRDNQMLSITTASLYKDKDDEFDVKLVHKKLKSYTTISVNYSGDVNSIQELNKNLEPKKGELKTSLKAVEGGIVRVNFQTNNSKFRNLYCDILIGDGSKENPYYISTAEQLYAIGRGEDGAGSGNYENYANNLYYELISDINCVNINGGYWEPVEFSGHLNGNGHTIRNINLDADHTEGTNLGLFSKLTSNAIVDNVVLSGVTVNVKDSGNYVVGALAAENQGVIQRVQVQSISVRSNNKNAVIGGVVGINNTDTSTLTTARLDRVTANVDFAYATEDGLGGFIYSGIKGTVGGLAGKNLHGTIINCYTTGSANVANNENAKFAGIVSENTSSVIGYAAHIKNCYSVVHTTFEANDTYIVGGIVNTNTSVLRDDAYSDEQVEANIITGNYYLDTMTQSEDATVTISNVFVDQELRVQAMPKTSLQVVETYKSSKVYDYIYNNITGKYDKVERLDGNSNPVYEPWDFEYTWTISNNVNEGYPYLTYSNVSVADGLDVFEKQEIITTANELITKLMNSDGAVRTKYFIANDIDMNDATVEYNGWKAVGTIDRPFDGSVQGMAADTTISHLVFTDDYDYAGFIGYLNGNGSVIDLTLDGVTALKANNYKYAAGMVVFNGSTIPGGEVTNCKVLNANINATLCASGVVAVNYGMVQGVGLGGTTTVQLNLKNANGAYAYIGGLIGQNERIIATSEDGVQNAVAGNVNIITNEETVSSGIKAYVGGAVGYNKQTVQSVKVDIAEGYGIKAICNSQNTFNSQYGIGGIVGYNDDCANIKACEASVDIVAPRNVNSVWVGGIVGHIQGKIESYTSENIENYYAVFQCYVHNMNVTLTSVGNGYCVVGGLAGFVSIVGTSAFDVKYSQTLFNSGHPNYASAYTVQTSNYKWQPTIVASFVNDVTLGGMQTGGLVGNLRNGIVLDCGANNITLNAKSNAGLVFHTYNSSLVYRCYSVVAFDGNENYVKYYVAENNTGIANNGYVKDSFVLYQGNASSARDDDNTYINKTDASTTEFAKGIENKNWASRAATLADTYTTYWALAGEGAVRVEPFPVPSGLPGLVYA